LGWPRRSYAHEPGATAVADKFGSAFWAGRRLFTEDLVQHLGRRNVVWVVGTQSSLWALNLAFLVGAFFTQSSQLVDDIKQLVLHPRSTIQSPLKDFGAILPRTLKLLCHLKCLFPD